VGFFKKKLDHLLLWSGSSALCKLVSINPRYAYLRITENCNSRCKTCFAWKNKSIRELTTEEIKDVLKQLRDVGVELVWLSGGEPLIRNDIGKLVKECTLLGFKQVFVQTNGLLLQEKANELIANGVTHIDVSIDGIGKMNDWIRGVPQSYEKSLQGIETINRIKKERNLELPGVTVFSTLLQQNFEEVPRLVEMCRKLGVFWDFSLLDDNVDFFKEIDISEFTITDHKRIDILIDYLKKIHRDVPGVISPSHTDLSLEYARRYLKGNSIGLPCVLGFTHICIGSHGEVYSGCLAQGPVGNLRKSSLLQIIRSKRYRENVEKVYMKQCSGCTFFFTTNLYAKHLMSHWVTHRREG
jgi:MoaA/NifB/PqqE/SkfB family radical SAM enzyme